MKLPRTLQPLLDTFRGEQLRPTLILLTSTLLILAWRYFGSPEFYLTHLSPYCVLWNDPQATAGVYYFATCFLLMGLVPVLIVKLLLRQSLADYGVQLGDRRRTFSSLLVLAPLLVLVAYLFRNSPEIVNEYPINRSAGTSAGMFGIHAVTYMLFYLGWEFHFRGFLQFGLRDKLGAPNALLVQVMASSLAHIGKPCSETFAAIAGGVVWGLIAYRTRSLLSGLLQHFLLGISLDFFICYC
jgi:membrane protease YdiL (CAAX protease family)